MAKKIIIKALLSKGIFSSFSLIKDFLKPV